MHILGMPGSMLCRMVTFSVPHYRSASAFNRGMGTEGRAHPHAVAGLNELGRLFETCHMGFIILFQFSMFILLLLFIIFV